MPPYCRSKSGKGAVNSSCRKKEGFQTGVAVPTGEPFHMICTFRIEEKIKIEESALTGGKNQNHKKVRYAFIKRAMHSEANN